MEWPRPTHVTAKSRSFPIPLCTELLYLHIFPHTTLPSQLQSLMAHYRASWHTTEPHGTLQSLMAHYKRPPHFHLHTSLILLFHCPTYSSPSSYSNNSILLLCIYFVILSTTLSSCDQYERKHPGVKYRCRGCSARMFLHLVKARQIHTDIYIGFKTFLYVVRHLDSIASYLPTGLHLGLFRSWPSLYPPSSFSSVFLVLSFVSASTSVLFWVISQIQDLGANGIWLQNKTAIHMLFFSGMIFLLSVRSQYSLVLLFLKSYPFNP